MGSMKKGVKINHKVILSLIIVVILFMAAGFFAVKSVSKSAEALDEKYIFEDGEEHGDTVGHEFFLNSPD